MLAWLHPIAMVDVLPTFFAVVKRGMHYLSRVFFWVCVQV